MERWLNLTIAGLLALAPTTAAARPLGPDPGVPEFNHTLSFGGGAVGFVREGPWTLARVACWNLVYSYSPATPVAWELVGGGGMDLTSAARTDHDQLVMWTMEGDLRVNVLPLTSVYPFVAGGVGYGVFQRGGESDVSTLTWPLSTGVEALLHTVSLQTRFTYRPTRFDDSVRFTERGTDSWQWTGSVGARF